MNESEFIRAYLSRCLVFYGSRVNALPYRIFSLYKVLTASLRDPALLLPELTKGQALYDEEEKLYHFREEDGTETDLTRSDTVLWVSLFQDPAGYWRRVLPGSLQSRRRKTQPCSRAWRL